MEPPPKRHCAEPSATINAAEDQEDSTKVIDMEIKKGVLKQLHYTQIKSSSHSPNGELRIRGRRIWKQLHKVEVVAIPQDVELSIGISIKARRKEHAGHCDNSIGYHSDGVVTSGALAQQAEEEEIVSSKWDFNGVTVGDSWVSGDSVSMKLSPNGHSLGFIRNQELQSSEMNVIDQLGVSAVGQWFVCSARNVGSSTERIQLRITLQ